MNVLGSTWRHRETGARGQITAWQRGNQGAAGFTMEPLGHPDEPSDPWPFEVIANYGSDTEGLHIHTYVSSYDVVCRDVSLAELRSDWEQE